MTEPFLCLDGVTLEFRRRTERFRALDNVSLTLARGRTHGIVGESGSGKSTLLRVIAGTLAPDVGRVTLGGQPLTALGRSARARCVQMVFQDPYSSLHPRMTVDTALSEPLRIHRSRDVSRRVAAALDLVGLPASLRYRYPNQLSGGQRQRVAIARALILEPELLLLDEPTSALDVSVQAEILNLLSDIRSARGLTCLLVSHDLAVVTHLCATVGVMRNGQLIEEAAAADFAAERLRAPYSRMLVATAAAYEAENGS